MISITAHGETVALDVTRCPHCFKGRMVRAHGESRIMGHVVVAQAFRGPVAVMSAACPGRVTPSSRHGILRRGSSRMDAYMRGLRAVVSLRNT